MEEKHALACLAALAHETRLAIFRLLVQQGPAGVPAGEIAQRLTVASSTLSFHLKDLEHAGLIHAVRQHRQILYAADYAGMRSLLDFIQRDCCQGHSELCGIGPESPACAGPAGKRARKEAIDA
jgi:ArsR family transcriptional regulator